MLSKKADGNWTGQIVGVIFFNGTPPPQSERMFDVMLTNWPSARWLEETKVSHNATNTTLAEVALVRKTLAWITGIILLIATLLGVRLSNNSLALYSSFVFTKIIFLQSNFQDSVSNKVLINHLLSALVPPSKRLRPQTLVLFIFLTCWKRSKIDQVFASKMRVAYYLEREGAERTNPAVVTSSLHVTVICT